MAHKIAASDSESQRRVAASAAWVIGMCVVVVAAASTWAAPAAAANTDFAGAFRLQTRLGDDCAIAGMQTSYVAANCPDGLGNNNIILYHCGYASEGGPECTSVATLLPPTNTTNPDYPFNTTGLITARGITGNDTISEILAVVTEPLTGRQAPAMFFCAHNGTDSPATCAYIYGMNGTFLYNPIYATMVNRGKDIYTMWARDHYAYMRGLPTVDWTDEITPPGLYFVSCDHWVDIYGVPHGTCVDLANITIDDPAIVNMSIARNYEGLVAIGNPVADSESGILLTYNCRSIEEWRPWWLTLPWCEFITTYFPSTRYIGGHFGRSIAIAPPLCECDDEPVNMFVTAPDVPQPLGNAGTFTSFQCNSPTYGGACLEVQTFSAPFTPISEPLGLPNFGTSIAATVIGLNAFVTIGAPATQDGLGLGYKYVCAQGVLCQKSRTVFNGVDDYSDECLGFGVDTFITPVLTGFNAAGSAYISEIRTDLTAGTMRRSVAPEFVDVTQTAAVPSVSILLHPLSESRQGGR